jgi:enoyl-CoA hydratase/carnithine racemase
VSSYVWRSTSQPGRTIRLDRPPVNALSAQIQDELLAAEEAARDERVGAVVLWGGEKVFAAGADIKEMNDSLVHPFGLARLPTGWAPT